MEGVIQGDEVVTTPHGMAQALRAYWSPIFQFQKQDETFRSLFLDPGIRDGRWNFASSKPPSSRDSAPGPDGIPYSGWEAAGPAGLITLEGVSGDMRNEARAPPWVVSLAPGFCYQKGICFP